MCKRCRHLLRPFPKAALRCAQVSVFCHGLPRLGRWSEKRCQMPCLSAASRHLFLGRALWHGMCSATKCGRGAGNPRWRREVSHAGGQARTLEVMTLNRRAGSWGLAECCGLGGPRAWGAVVCVVQLQDVVHSPRAMHAFIYNIYIGRCVCGLHYGCCPASLAADAAGHAKGSFLPCVFPPRCVRPRHQMQAKKMPFTH